MKRHLLAAAAAVVVGATTVISPAASAQSSGLEILSDTIEATVNRDGSMDVVETLAYDFHEALHGGFRTFEPGGADYRIVGFHVTEDGEPRELAPGFEEPNFGGQVRWFGGPEADLDVTITGRHDYELRYTVEGAVDVFPDTAVLNWQFIGSDFPHLDEVRVDVTFPGDGADLRAFGHGVLHGVIEPVGNQVALRVVDNPAGQFVEARITLPTSDFDVAPSGEPVLDQILAEEGALADAANQQREQARQLFDERFAREVHDGVPGDCDGASGELGDRCDRLAALLEEAAPRVDAEHDVDDADLLLDLIAARESVDDVIDRIRDERNALIGNIAAPIAAVVGVVLWFLVWRRWGKDPMRPADVGEYFRDVPPESPAVVASIDDLGGVDSKAFVATLVDLAQRGWVTITPNGKKDHRFTRTQKADGEPLKDYEAGLLWRLFPTGRSSVTQDELTDEAKHDRTVSASWMRGFRGQVEADYDAQGWQAKTGPVPWLLWLSIVVGLDAVGVLAVLLKAWLGVVVAFATSLVLFVLGPLLRRRTEKGARKLAEVRGLKKFLEDFSLVDDVPIGHLALYERYLVYAVALGVADKLIDGLRVRFPDMVNDPGFAPWYGSMAYGGMGGGGLNGIDRLAELGSIGSFAGDFTRATSAAFSPPSSSGGGGGGFSGGGGGGGGGGGAGGW